MQESWKGGQNRTIIGMVHLPPLPGTPFYEQGGYERAVKKAVSDATALYRGGASGCLVQTIDRVYPTGDEADPLRVAAVANIVRAIAQATAPPFQIGVQILRNAISASLAVALASGGSFVRCAALVGATMSHDGIVEANPLAVTSYRRRIGAMNIAMIAEVRSMHYRALNGEAVAETARAAAGAGAGALSLGDPDEAESQSLVREVRAAVPRLPIFLAGYTNHENAARRLAEVDGAFVGTCLEKGEWGSAVDEERVRAYMQIVATLPPPSTTGGSE